MEFKITGWKAIAVLVIAVVFAGIRYQTQSGTLETQGVTKIQNWLMAESERAAMPEMEKAMNGEGGGDQALEAMAQNLQKTNFEILSVTRHGSGSIVIARVKERFTGGANAGDTRVRYLRMSYSMVTGWHVVREVSKWAYYAAALGSSR